MNIQKVKISEVKNNPNNPRTIKDDKFQKLVQSIKDFPKMLEIRPIVVNDDMIVLGGNMRLKACKEAGLKEVTIIKASELTEDEQKQFIIKDNVSGGEWDWEMLNAEWYSEELEAWGLDVPKDKTNDEKELFDIELPFYTPLEEKPKVIELADISKTKELIEKIEVLNIDDKLKEILKIRASFFTDFNFQKIADYYYNESDEIKEIMKDLGMVILAPKEALEKGFVEISENIFDI
jgi:uncharacterized protein (DUF2164 family)